MLRPRCRRAFTLVELLLVVMVLGVLAGIAAPRYQASLNGVELEAATRRLAIDLRRARDEALTRATTIEITFLPLLATYRSETINGEFLADPDHPEAPLVVRVADSARVALASADFGGAAKVSFDFRGDPSSEGVVQLTNGAKTTAVKVESTGEITVTL